MIKQGAMMKHGFHGAQMILKRKQMNFKQKGGKAVAAAGIMLLWIFILLKTTGIAFELNDDRCIAEILSGGMTGSPEARTVYMNYFLGLPLSALYRILPQVPWYGGMLVLCHLGLYAALTASFWSRAEKPAEYAVFTGLAGCLVLGNLYMTAAIQYTSTAALAAVAGYGCLILRGETGKGMRWFVFFEALAFLLRGQAMLMVQPLGAAVCAGLYLADRKISPGRRWMRTGRMAAALALILLAGTAGVLLSFRGQGWQDYYRFNRAEEKMFDYYKQPAYEEVKHILDRYGVSETEYIAYCNYVILDWDISVPCAEELAEYAESGRKSTLDGTELLAGIGREAWSGEYMGMNRAAAAAWAAVLLWMLIFRRYGLALPLAGLFLGRSLVWGYLVYVDRLPYRVTLPLFAGELILTAALLVRDYREYKTEQKDQKKEKWGELTWGIFILLTGVFCVLTGKAQYGAALEANARQEIFIESLAGIGDYCREHPENRYLLDTQSVMECNGGVFETRIYGNHNYVYTGTWYSNSPGVRRHLREYLEDGKRGFCLIVRDDGKGADHYGVVYMAEKLGAVPQEADRFVTANGSPYLVWEFH